MASTFKSNSAGWRKVLRSDQAQAATNQVAERKAAVARSIARVDTGAYRDSIHVEEAPTNNRARSVVVADVPYALVLEAKDNTLGKALAS